MSDKGPFLFLIELDHKQEDSRQAYNELYSATSLSQIESFYLWLMKIIQLQPGETLLDVSCGAGEVVRLAALAGSQAVGVDISETVARAAYARTPPDHRIAVSAGEALPFSAGSFEVVTNIGSLEHFIDPGKGAAEMARVLHPGGRAYILVPNTFSLLTNVWEAFRHGRTSVDDQPIQRYGSRADWVRLLEINGLQVTETIKYERPWPYHPPDWGYYLRRPKEFIRLIAGPFVPLNLAFCFLFECRKRNSDQQSVHSSQKNNP